MNKEQEMMAAEPTPYKLRWNRTDTMIVVLGALALLVLLYMYGKLPDVVNVHFNSKGEVDRTMSRAGYIAMSAVFIILLPLTLKLAPLWDWKSSARRGNIETFETLRLFIALFMMFVCVTLGLFNIYDNLPLMNLVTAAIGVLLLFIGNTMGRFRPNWYIDIRTPWTLNEQVWRKTHRMSGSIWFAGGVLILLASLLAEPYCLYAAVSIILLLAGFSLWYSFRLGRSLDKKPPQRLQ